MDMVLLKPSNTKQQTYLILNMKPTSQRKRHARHRRNATRCIRHFCTLVLRSPLFMTRFLIFLRDKRPVWVRERDSEDGVSISGKWISTVTCTDMTYSASSPPPASLRLPKACPGHRESGATSAALLEAIEECTL